MMDPSQVDHPPGGVEEKKLRARQSAGKYVFRVHPDAHKTQIRQAVEALFDVKVRRRPHRRDQEQAEERGLTSGRSRTWKKAIVQVGRATDPDLPGPGGR